MKRFARKTTVIAILLLVSGVPALYAEEGNKYLKEFDFNPVILDAQDNAKTTLGIEYKIKGTILDKTYTTTDSGSESLNPEVTIGGLQIDYNLSGTITDDKDTNPRNFIESQISGNYLYSSSFTGIAGFFYKYENNQSFNASQHVYGLSATVAKYGIPTENSYVALDVKLGQVDPIKDDQRKAVLGSDPGPYYRVDAEALVSLNIDVSEIRAFEFDYRYFKEIDPPGSINNAGLDEFKLATSRLSFKKNLYIAYSTGRLPFDKKSDQVYTIGFTVKLK